MDYTFVVMQTFGEWVKAHRKKLDLYQADIAKRAGLSVSYISTIERGQPHSTTGEKIRPDKDVVIAIAKAVQGNVDEALDLAGYASSKKDPIPPRVKGLFHEAELWSDRKWELIADMIEKDIEVLNKIMPEE